MPINGRKDVEEKEKIPEAKGHSPPKVRGISAYLWLRLGRWFTLYENRRLSKAKGLVKIKVQNLKEKKVAEAIREIILKGKELKMTVKTDSMLPLLNPGDKILLRKCRDDNLLCGDVIVYMIDYVSYVHRFIFKKKRDDRFFLITKPDKAFFFNTPIPLNQLIGRIIAVEKKRFNINLESAFWKAINRFLGLFSFLEGIVFNLLRLVKRKLFKDTLEYG